MEIFATLFILFIGGICLAFLAIAGLLFTSLIKLALFPVSIAFDVIKWVVLCIVGPIVVFVVIPIVLLIVVPVLLAVTIPLFLGFVVLGVPFLLLIGFLNVI
ncbi:MAG: hypothetical protein R3338_02270 [Thermoanaerobaculia bacterium]|nr:hypothetical protein [Thermoanaerobaculia bacterium]